jgi:transcriptional regulator with XRE-family HTH domain
MGTARKSPPSLELRVFSERLQKAIEFKRIDISVLARESEYKPDDIHKLLSGMREPGLKKLMLLSSALGCSVDYLLGLTSEPKRAGVVVLADTDVLNRQSSERGQTSGQISGKLEQFITTVPKLLDADVEMFTYLAKFLIDRREKIFLRFSEKITKSSEKEKLNPDKISVDKLKGKAGFDDCLDDDGFDDLWEDDIEIEFDDEFLEDKNEIELEDELEDVGYGDELFDDE